MIFAVENGGFAYGQRKAVLQNVNFSFSSDSIMSVLGANGAGKTTLLRCMLGLQPWSTGRTLIDGTEASQIPYSRFWQRIGYVPQAKPAGFSYSVREMAVLGRSAHLGSFATPGKKDWDTADASLEKVGIAHLRDRMCNEISGGELQMVLIARALAVNPEMLVLDEPESNLDFKNQLRVLEVLLDLRDNHGIGSIINTHFPAHAMELGGSSLVMMKNRQPVYGPVKEVLTEEILTESFGIGVRIADTAIAERPGYKCIVAVRNRQ